MNQPPLKAIIEAALLNAGQPLNIERLQALFPEDERPESDAVKAALDELTADWEGRSVELKQVASGYRFQVRSEFAPWIGRLSEERQPRYSRALLETLALIVYRQPITRAGIEEIRGVSVSSHIIRTLLEREWIRVVGHRDVPGRPALYGTTKRFLDYFNLRSLSELPALAEIKPLDQLQANLGFFDGEGGGEEGNPGADAQPEADTGIDAGVVVPIAADGEEADDAEAAEADAPEAVVDDGGESAPTDEDRDDAIASEGSASAEDSASADDSEGESAEERRVTATEHA
jgi:segregation and condensation protein B